ncbi:hypothetical protein KA183_16660 [bacterium]|nr:hypothetical protein [bacterium]QQR59206.1 MAG: hypothetical protein IPG59_06865 [Candidatus Melainabacteria bacterium]
MSSDPSQSASTSGSTSIQQMVNKIVELQDKLVEAQEKNLLLSTQLRELEMATRDSDDLKAELSNQTSLLADKIRENKRLHQDLSRVSTALESKLKDLEEVKSAVVDLQKDLKQREAERDLLAVMLTEKEKEGARASAQNTPDSQKKDQGWMNPFAKGKQ